ncbi:hypothetical protein QJS04_geneDACA024777 [Acorus gramineus]|uniref:Uncharacterized protein n=1 Tax=Acorus gramineus TaxID=55184 RepID=A0AAV8ZX39_ACOGR|nr:hypothetical protein QJS04_geneDACA024777 [Acorus gramineus]
MGALCQEGLSNAGAVSIRIQRREKKQPIHTYTIHLDPSATHLINSNVMNSSEFLQGA